MSKMLPRDNRMYNLNEGYNLKEEDKINRLLWSQSRSLTPAMPEHIKKAKAQQNELQKQYFSHRSLKKYYPIQGPFHSAQNSKNNIQYSPYH